MLRSLSIAVLLSLLNSHPSFGAGKEIGTPVVKEVEAITLNEAEEMCIARIEVLYIAGESQYKKNSQQYNDHFTLLNDLNNWLVKMLNEAKPFRFTKGESSKARTILVNCERQTDAIASMMPKPKKVKFADGKEESLIEEFLDFLSSLLN